MEDDRDKALERAMARNHYSGDALIEILHAAQELYGYLSKPLLKTVARKLKLPPSRVLGVASFYHLFRLAPPSKHTAVVCLGTACWAAGGSDLMDTLEHHCGRKPDWTLESGRCVGSCGLAPNVVYDGETLGRVTVQQMEERLEEVS